jgi:hypothetical protein
MHKLAVSLVTVVAAATAFPPMTSPVPGPGGVIAALRDVSTALDRGDAAAVVRVFDARRKPDLWIEESAGKGRMGSADDAFAFTAVAADGKPFEARSIEAFTTAMLGGIASGEGREVATKLVSIRADCASPECSFGLADLERTYQGRGGKATTQRLRITALLRYDDDTRGFRIFHWHESLRD